MVSPLEKKVRCIGGKVKPKEKEKAERVPKEGRG
jgi:hypothetical protein